MVVLQGVVTCICTILTAATRLGDPVYFGKRHTTEKSQSHRRFLPKSQSHCGILPKSQGHGGFPGEVTRSQPNIRLSQIMTPVTAVKVLCILE